VRNAGLREVVSSVTLAFLDNPLAIAVIFVAILILFGPKKVPEIAGQLGRALRDFRRATSDFSRTLNMDDHDTSYTPPTYDNYSNNYYNESETSSYSSSQEDHMYVGSETTPSETPEPPRGDFAAAAFADTTDDYGVSAPAPTESDKSHV
jgi:TatA/E family protein of Tat protein translocase